jgi:hypothetical protein
MTAAKTITGSSIICYINNKLYSRVSNFTWDSQTINKAIYALDSNDPFELGATQTKIGGTVSVYRLHGDGGAQGAGMVPEYASLSRGKYFSITLIDRFNNQVLFNASNCVLQSETWSVPSKGIITGSLRFEAIDWSNEKP